VGRGLGWERIGRLGVIVILVLTFLLLEGEGLSESKCSVRKLTSIERSVRKRYEGDREWLDSASAGRPPGRHESCRVQTKPKYKDTIKEQIHTCLRASSQRRNKCSGEVPMP
jgi:hypothetical protein